MSSLGKNVGSQDFLFKGSDWKNQPDLFIDQDFEDENAGDQSNEDDLLIVNAPGVLVRKLEFLGIQTYSQLRRRKNELRSLQGFGSQCEVALQRMLSDSTDYSMVDTGDVIANPPSILARKLEQLGIKTYADLKLKVSDLRSIDGYGKKSENALVKWLPELELDDSTIAIPSFQSIQDRVNKLYFVADGFHHLFLFSVPSLIQEKFDHCAVGSIASLRDKFDDLAKTSIWKQRSIRMLSEFVEANIIGYTLSETQTDCKIDFIEALNDEVVSFCNDCDEVESNIILGRIGIETTTFQQLAERHNISKERVRQLEQKLIYIELSNLILGYSDVSSEYATLPTQSLLISLKKDCFQNLILDRDFVLRKYGELFNDDLNVEKWRKLCAILKIVGLSLLEVTFCGEVELVVLTPQIHTAKFLNLFHLSCDLLREEITPLLVENVIDKIKSPGADIEVIAIERFFYNSQYFEMFEGGLCLKLKYLSSRKAQAIRILWQRGEKMHFNEIALEIFTCKGSDEELEDAKSPTAGMFHSGRMYTIGKTGYWALKEWDVDDRNLADRMVAAFKSSGQPMSTDQLLESEHLIGMDYPRSSVQAYLSMGYNGLFDGIGQGEYILSEWRDTMGALGEKKRHYHKADWHYKLKEILGNDCLTAREISARFNELHGVNDNLIVVNQRLAASPNLSSKFVDKKKHWFWSNDDVIAPRKTVRLCILDDLKDLILNSENKQILLSDAREQLTKLHAIPNATFYAAVSSSDNIQKTEDVNGKVVLSYCSEMGCSHYSG